MSRESTLLILGVVIILAPFLGLPYAWLMVIEPLLGLGVIALAILVRARRMTEEHPLPPPPSIDETQSIV